MWANKPASKLVLLSHFAGPHTCIESRGFGKTRGEVIIENLTLGTSHSFSLNFTDSLKQFLPSKNNSDMTLSRVCPHLLSLTQEDKRGTVLKATLILAQVCWPTCMLSFAAWLEILLESMGFGKTRDEIIIGNLTVGTSPSFSLNLTDSLKNNFYCRKIIQTRNCPEFVLDPRGQNEDKTRVIRGVGGWFKRPKKCYTPSENEISKNMLKICPIPIQTSQYEQKLVWDH